MILNNLRGHLARHPKLALTLLTICVSVPFLDKPFNIDDPLFIWTAHQIQAHPFDPYGFKVVWGWGRGPMWLMSDNPPLTSYYIAAATLIVGWSEVALHLVFLLPTLAVILGMLRLARIFSAPPGVAALATLFTPGFLISSTTVMSDMPMLALWVWAIIFWIDGMEENRLVKLGESAVLVALAELTKYYGMCLVPLLVAYSIAARKRVGLELAFLLIPIAVLCAYQYATRRLYGMNLVSDVANFSLGKSLATVASGDSCLKTLTFIGGCFATILFFAPLLWKKQAALIWPIILLTVCAIFWDSTLLAKYPIPGYLRRSAEIQSALWASAGASAVALTVLEMLARRDAKTLMLLLWVCGTFVFTAFCNWTIDARSILPMAPALGLLIAQRLKRNFEGSPFCRPAFLACIAASAAFAIYATEADCLLAVAIRQNVRAIYEDYGPNLMGLHFEGHWGFQYYMSNLGASPLDYRHDKLKAGDLVAIPFNNTNILPPARGKGVLLRIYSEPGPPLLTTVSPILGAGFYASVIGPLPFVVGPVPRETVAIYSLR
ncbi:MAG: glycosyltransferase family 39 protein [Limisphaerales bacterium]